MKRTLARLLRHSRLESSGCWAWTGGVARGGYGKMTHRGRTTVAHRVAYETCIGPVPAGLQLDHLCRNPACINPLHLEPVTCRENLLRGNTLQARNAAKTHCPQGHAYTDSNTYRYPDGRRRCVACRRIDDVRPHHVERRKLYKRRVPTRGDGHEAARHPGAVLW